MRGECSGKVRSTPTPYEIRRTVNEARAPSPCLRMTTPSKACIRSFSPSIIFTCTRTVSPGSNPPRSFLSCPASTKRIASMTSSPFLSPPLRLRRSRPAVESFYHLLFLIRQLRLFERVRPRAARPPQGLRAAPPRDPRVIAGQQHRGHVGAAELLGPRVLRRFQQAVREGLSLGGALAPQHAGDDPNDGVGHDERGQLASGQDVIAD